ncbi:hypothetical protein KIN20_004162 [Parelaphostrongylus tenuis]|uniref:Uncharacterized protein n=1 Tax=Parelaphostrongylus tenuis TaxID=148309 RepID=A0AAD5MGL6_PARTN|nr:hypothetical protein KIN20_004162 [Parelaphostrongylus tenuis]
MNARSVYPMLHSYQQVDKKHNSGKSRGCKGMGSKLIPSIQLDLITSMTNYYVGAPQKASENHRVHRTLSVHSALFSEFLLDRLSNGVYTMQQETQ